MAVYGESLVETVMMAASNKQGENVIINIDMTLDELMAKVGCSHGLIVEAMHAGCKANYKIEGVQIDAGDFHALAPIKLGVLNDILNNKLSKTGAAIPMIRVGLEKAVKNVLALVHSTGAGTPYTLPQNIPKDAKISFLNTEGAPNLGDIFKVKPAGKPPKPVFVEEHGIPYVPSSKHTLPALKDATYLYQPVHGTDEGSTYYVVALSGTLKVAARIKNKNNVSIRVEGSGVKAFKPQLKAAGLVDSGTYCSVHLSADTDDLARKSVGAVLYGMGQSFNEVGTDLNSIWGKGQ
jgi:hypothetical protein